MSPEVVILELFLDSGPIMCWTEAPPEGEALIDGMGHVVTRDEGVSVFRVQWDAYLEACRHVRMFEEMFGEMKP